MMVQTETDTKYLDPVFLKYGQEVYTYDYIEELRKENLDLKRKGKRSYNLIPQAGFQENVLTNEADIKIIGGSRGSGKTACALIGAMMYAENPDINMYGFRRFEADVKRKYRRKRQSREISACRISIYPF